MSKPPGGEAYGFRHSLEPKYVAYRFLLHANRVTVG